MPSGDEKYPAKSKNEVLDLKMFRLILRSGRIFQKKKFLESSVKGVLKPKFMYFLRRFEKNASGFWTVSFVCFTWGKKRYFGCRKVSRDRCLGLRPEKKENLYTIEIIYRYLTRRLPAERIRGHTVHDKTSEVPGAGLIRTPYIWFITWQPPNT